MVLVFGATGKTGKEIIKQLLLCKTKIRVLIRNPENKKAFTDQGIDVCIGDANNEHAIVNALKGITKVYLLIANSQHQLTQEKLITDCAKKQGVDLIVKQSSLETTTYQENPIPKVHLESEQHIKNSGLNWVIIRPTFFSQMLLMCSHSIKTKNALVFPMLNGCVAATDVRDVAEVAAKVLTEEGHHNKIYHITGPELLSFNTIASILSTVLERKITYTHQPLSDYRQIIAPRLNDEWRVNAVCEEIDTLAKGGTKRVYTNNTEEILGRPPTPITQFIEDYKMAFMNEE